MIVVPRLSILSAGHPGARWASAARAARSRGGALLLHEVVEGAPLDLAGGTGAAAESSRRDLS